ncbi:hypothetical protein [Bradyrhizobium sp. CCBAU 53380]|uniref:hypothetical protein n=1 Tax=Bradyrhizobium sp. CCBAU 53380 TaxID=1325117 RepID=UPI002304C823|nr:hypothetical protein [Bradyrhizobium sp. CCBAU 53380]
MKRRSEYWRRALGALPAVLEPPADRSRAAQQDFSGGYTEFALNEVLAAQLSALTWRRETTLFMTLEAGTGAVVWSGRGIDRDAE